MDMDGSSINAATAKSPIKKGIIFPIILAILVSAFIIGVQSYKHIVYEVFINQTSVGFVKETSTYDAAIDAIVKTDGEEAADSLEINRRIVFEQIKDTPSTDLSNAISSNSDSPKHYVSSEAIEFMARSMLGLKQPAVAMCVNGTTLAVVADTDTAKKIEEGILDYYTPSDSSCKVISVKIKEDIELKEVYEYTRNLMDCDSAINKIVSGVESPKVYVIQAGDTIWDISVNNDIPISEIQDLNPELDINNIHVGDEIYLSSLIPYVNVEVIADITSQETIPYETVKKSDSSLLKGVTKVITKGENGLKQVVVKTTKVNGITTNQEVLSSTVLKEPVNEVVAVGTKVLYYTASRGTSSVSAQGFIRPCPGILTSNYGWRGGEFHSGVDLAASTGTPIVAAKAGTVVYSGWKGSLGYCIIIDHGNGVQTVYGHNSQLIASVGSYVSQGQTIALMGSTGRATGPHCHFEVRINGTSKNPWNYID